MKNFTSLIIGCSLFIINLISQNILAQTAPYSIPPKWFFGKGGGTQGCAGIDFTSGAPTEISGGIDNLPQEAGNTMVDTAGNIAFYTVSCQVLYNSLNANVGSINGDVSSTDGAVSVPDPQDPFNKYYLFVAAVDNGIGASNNNQGLGWYHISVSGSTVTILSGPTWLRTRAQVSEALTAGSDGSTGYWIVAHGIGNTNYYSWHVTSTGVGAMVTSTGTVTGTTNQSSLKINRCQNFIGYVGNGFGGEVGVWNRTSGTVTSIVKSFTGSSFYYGAEISLDGTQLYYSTLSPAGLYQFNTTTGATTTLSTASSNNYTGIGTMQLSPTLDKIYVLNAAYVPTGNVYLGVIKNINTGGTANYNPTGYTYADVAAGVYYPYAFYGISNEAWIDPTLNINNAGSCTFGYNFKTYYRKAINTKYMSEVWDFGDGTGAHTGLGSNPTYNNYPHNGAYTVTLTVTDSVCATTWTNTLNVNVACVLPVDLINFTASYTGQVNLSWTTATETNNAYFNIERSSDGINFTTIGIVEGNDNSNTLLKYTYTDLNPINGVSYYRLNQVDINGAQHFSSIISVEVTEGDIVIAPNPYQDNFTITLNNIQSNAIITVSDILGRIVSQIQVGDNVHQYTLGSNLDSGTYIIQVVTSNKIITKKVIKE